MDIQISLKVFMTSDSPKQIFERIINCDSQFDYVGVTSSMFALFGSKCKILYEVVL